MAKKRVSKVDKQIEEAVLEEGDDALPGAMETVFPDLGVADDPIIVGEEDGPVAPEHSSPEWSDYVLSHFLPEELDPEGNPTVDGLRRVVELLLGPIIEVRPHVVECPSESNMHRATATVTVSIAFDYDRRDVRVFGDGADVYSGNTDTVFARFPVATVITRAEARAYRKALKLRRVVSAEEVTKVSVTESGIEKFITGDQVKSLDKLSRDLDIDTAAMLKKAAVTKDFADFSNITYSAALKVLENVGEYFRGEKPVPASVAGYKKGWFKLS